VVQKGKQQGYTWGTACYLKREGGGEGPTN